MFCTYCGQTNPENIEYCVHCGKKIGVTSAESKPKAPAIPFARKYGAWAIILAGALILLGFIMPWASVNIGGLFSGSYSALTGFFALIVGLFGSMAGAASIYNNSGSGAGGILVIFSLIMLIPIVLIVVFGILHLRNGFRMKKIEISNKDSFVNYGNLIKGRSIACLIFLGIYFLFALGLSSFRLSGFLGSLMGGSFLGTGFWMTTIGYIIALVISINLINEDVSSEKR